MKEESASESESESIGHQNDKHCLFENDNYRCSMLKAVWHDKKIPSKRQLMMENRVVATRGRPPTVQNQAKELTKKAYEDQKPNFSQLKEII